MADGSEELTYANPEEARAHAAALVAAAGRTRFTHPLEAQLDRLETRLPTLVETYGHQKAIFRHVWALETRTIHPVDDYVNDRLKALLNRYAHNLTVYP